jgi:LmbE family N-acetylglucosaminyl deacetylase
MKSPKVALSLLAHPDDAECLCGGTLIRLRDAGWDVHIASMTPGDSCAEPPLAHGAQPAATIGVVLL